jgi:hypothetical protein
VCSSEFSRSAVSRCDVAAAAWSSPGIRRSFRVWCPPGIVRTGWTNPLRRWPVLGPVVFPQRTSSGRFKASRSFLSSSSAFLPSVLRPILSRLRARQALPRSSPELSSPSAHASGEGPPVYGLCLPAAFRLQGLATLLTVCALRSLFGFVSSRQRSWGLSRPSECSPPARYQRPCRPAMNPRTVSRAAAPSDESSGRTDAPRSLGFDPCGSSLPPQTPLGDAAARDSPGLHPFQGHHRQS